MTPNAKILKKYGKQVATKAHHTDEGLTLVFTTYIYYGEYFTIIECEGAEVLVARRESDLR